MLRIVIDGAETSVPEGTTILQALRKARVEVPTLCHDDRLKPYGGCRLCSVEVEGSPRLLAACATPVTDGMRVHPNSAKAETQRRTILSLLALRYPAGGPLDEHLELHRYLKRYGIAPTGTTTAGAFKDGKHPCIAVDMDKCVYCYRCVRICDELQGQLALQAWYRGAETRIRPDRGDTLLESSCVSCGACVTTCPSGALSDVAIATWGRPDTWTRTTCPYCGVGCEIVVGVRDGKVRVALPGAASPVNRGHLCVKGRYAHGYVHAEDRITEPMIRAGAVWKRVSWDEALEYTARRLRAILERYGPDGVGVLGSSRATNEENYLAQKFSRVVLGSNNVDCCARVCHAPTAAALKVTLGTGAATNSFDDIEAAAGFLVVGANPTENHPVVGCRIKQAVLDGAKLVVVDPRRTELARMADVHLQLTPGTNVPVLNALAHTLIEEGILDLEFLEARTAELDAFRAFVAEWTPERAAEIAGVRAAEIREAARVYGKTRPAMIFHGLGMTEHAQGTDGVRCLVNLALLTGNLGRPGSGENPLRGQNNVQGSAHMGCEPNHLAGYAPIESAAALFESVWGVPVTRHKGANAMQMLDLAGRGALKALYCIGYDIYLSSPDAASSARALGNLDLLVVQDLFLNETARVVGHVFLPCTSSFEKEGTFMSSERRVQRVRQCIPPVGNTLPDWRILCALAERMGHGSHFAFDSAEAVWEEVRKVWKPGAGISYARIESTGLQWPCPDESHPGTRVLHSGRFSIGERAAFSTVPYNPTTELKTREFPMILSTGRTLYQFNAGTMTFRSSSAALHGTDYLEMSPDDAARLGVRTGDAVRIVSRHGEVVLPARVDLVVKPGELFTTFHDPRVFTNRVTGGGRDGTTGTPEYKVTAVRVERA